MAYSSFFCCDPPLAADAKISLHVWSHMYSIQKRSASEYDLGAGDQYLLVASDGGVRSNYE